MLHGESIKHMYMRFTEIIKNLKSLGKTNTNDEMVRKMSQCLPRRKWGHKVMTTEEAHLKTLKLDNLIEKLLTMKYICMKK